MLTATAQICVGILLPAATMAVLWLVQRRTGNAGIVDIAWAALTGTLGVFYAVTAGGAAERRLLAGAMIGLWSARLSIYLFRRVVGHPEEGRYATLRAGWGAEADRRFFRFYQMQAAAAFVFSLPVLTAVWVDGTPGPAAMGASIALWFAGAGGVLLADRQLERFKASPDSRGKTCRVGLWKYSRHPNYFFEWIHWWAYLPLSVGSPYWPVAAAVPVMLLYLVLRVTGIPPTEAQALASRGEDYRRYQRTTSAFFPWFPRKEHA